MMKTIKLLSVIILSSFLFSCTQKHDEPPPAAYDYNDEKNQDAFSRYMRATQVDWVIFNSDEMRKTLGRKNIPDNIYGKLYIRKIETRHPETLDKFTSKEEAIQYYSSAFLQKPCEKKNVQGLVCLEDRNSYRYFYFPNIDKNLSTKRKFPGFLFSCDRKDDEVDSNDLNCLIIRMSSSTPYNIDIDIHFNHPKHIFLILDYVDKHFYKVLGEHLWQPVHGKNKKQ